jgi:hypothetical protein
MHIEGAAGTYRDQYLDGFVPSTSFSINVADRLTASPLMILFRAHGRDYPYVLMRTDEGVVLVRARVYHCHLTTWAIGCTLDHCHLSHKSSITPTPSPTSMSSTTSSSSNFQLISNALSDYAELTGIDLTKNPFADELQNCDSANAISELLQDRAKAFKTYRDEHRKLINCFNPVVQFLHAFSGTLGEALVLVSSSESICILSF